MQIHIGTKTAFEQNYFHEYGLNPASGAYSCSKTTDNGLQGEISVLSKTQSTDGAWCTAVEGRVNDDNEFVPRQSVFRTQENFWEAGWHNWQVNEAASLSLELPIFGTPPGKAYGLRPGFLRMPW